MKSFLIITVIVFSFFCSQNTYADTNKALVLEFESLSNSSESFQPLITGFHNVWAKDGGFGGFIFMSVSETYAEAYAGPSLTFVNDKALISGGLGLGIEQSTAVDDHNPARLGGFFVIDTEKHLLSIIVEMGLTSRDFVEPYGYARYAYHLHEAFDAGVITRRFAGIGPRIDFWLHRPGLGISASPLYDPESKVWAGMLTLTTGY